MKTCVVFSGAGISAESGIPTFRDSNGLWENHKVEDVAHPDGWAKDKETVLRFYEQRINTVKKCEPNAAHEAVARLQDRFNVINFTQNIDDLLERGGCENVRHMHGSLFRRKCERHHNIGACVGDCDFIEEYDQPTKLGDLCPKCGGQLRPDVVWFTEAVQYEFEEIRELCAEVKYNDGIFICCGTSCQVQPAALLVSFFSQVKNKHIVDLAPNRVADYELHAGPASEMMPTLVERLLTEHQP